MLIPKTCTKIVKLPQGDIEYQDTGSGEVIVFIHGLFLNGDIWQPAVSHIQGHYRCIVPELPYGGHKRAMNKLADLSLQGNAQLIADFICALKLKKVTVVGLDFGGVIAQLVAVKCSSKVRALVLNNCDALEVFPAKGFGYLQYIPYIPGAMWLMAKAMVHISAVRNAPGAFAVFAQKSISDEQLLRWLTPLAKYRSNRRDVAKLLRSIDTKLTLALPALLKKAEIPVLLIWGEDDRLFNLDLANRLVATIGAQAQITTIKNAKTFVGYDQPETVASTLINYLDKLQNRR